MKSKEFFRLMINPFIRIAGWQAFELGIIFVILTAAFGALGNVYFDGVLDMHFVEKATFTKSFIIQAINIFSLVLIMWLAGFFISNNFRFIDILGTMTLAKAPFLLLALAALFTETPDLSQIMQNPLSIFNSTSFILLMLLSLPVMVWSITLMFNALKVSCDARGSKLTITFIIAIFIAEAVSKVLIYIIITNNYAMG